jgi:hypothetical protein
MALFRFSLTYHTRMGGSQSAMNVVQYLTREGRYAVPEAQKGKK